MGVRYDELHAYDDRRYGLLLTKHLQVICSHPYPGGIGVRTGGGLLPSGMRGTAWEAAACGSSANQSAITACVAAATVGVLSQAQATH